MTEYVEHEPTRPLIEIADALDADIAAIQLEQLLRVEAARTGNTRRFIRGLLVRRLHERIPDGWNVSTRYDFLYERAAACASWTAAVENEFMGDAKRAWNALKGSAIPDGWLPDGPDDPVIVAAFRGTRLAADA